MSIVSLISTTQAQRNLSQLVKRVSGGRERIVITAFDIPQAAMVNLKDLERIGVPKAMLDKRNQKRLAHFKKILKFQNSLQRAGKLKGHDPVEVLHEIRQQRDEQLLGLH